VSAKIRVLHLFSGDLWAGAEVVVANLIEQLEDDAAVESIAVGLNDGVLIRRLARRGIETHLLGEGDQGFARLAVDCSRRLRGRRIDVVHSHRYKENLLATVVAGMLGVRRKVTTVHGVTEVNPRAPLRGRLVRAIDRFNVRASFDAVVAVSAEMRTILLDWFGVRRDRVRLIQNGIAMPRAWDPGDRDGGSDVHIGTVGRMVPVKGHQLFLELAAHLRGRYPNVRFSILGEGPLMAQLTADAARLGVGDRVAFLPPQPDPQPYYRGLDIYVNTSLHEGLPLSVLEAMACGKPVVAARVGGIPEVVRHGEDGFLVEGRKPDAFAACCERMIEEPALRRTMGRNARARVAEAFGRERMAASYRALYEELCGEP
jgi:glycosyltransferase involved in cell wall biosynthesis